MVALDAPGLATLTFKPVVVVEPGLLVAPDRQRLVVLVALVRRHPFLAQV